MTASSPAGGPAGLTWEESVDELTVGLAPKLRRAIKREALRAAGHNDNDRSCYVGRCRHVADVAKAILRVFKGLQYV